MQQYVYSILLFYISCAKKNRLQANAILLAKHNNLKSMLNFNNKAERLLKQGRVGCSEHPDSLFL